MHAGAGASAGPEPPWQCVACTYIHKEAEALFLRCAQCETQRVVDRATRVYRARTGGRAHDDARGAVEMALGDRTFKRIASYFTRA